MGAVQRLPVEARQTLEAQAGVLGEQVVVAVVVEDAGTDLLGAGGGYFF